MIFPEKRHGSVNIFQGLPSSNTIKGEHITDTYITETDTAELENLTHTLS